jgi:phage gp16-like protein
MADLRKKDLAQIHINKQKLGLTEENYRALLVGLTGKNSTKEMDQKERWQVIREQRRLLGDKAAQKAPRGHFVGKPARQSPESGKQALLGKIEALLADRQLPWQYVHSMAQGMFKVSCVEWCNPDQLWRIVAAMEIQKRRIASRTTTEALKEVKNG